MSMTLEPCPFCGAAPIWRPQGNDHTKSRKLTLSCSGCRIQITNAAIRHDMDWLYQITAEAWNTRTQPAQSVDVAKLNKPARIGTATFGKGVPWSTVIMAAQRAYDAKPLTPEQLSKLRAMFPPKLTAALQEKGNG